MKNATIKSLVLGTVAALMLTAGSANALTVTLSSANMSNGYMNVFDLPSNGGGYIFGSGWGVADLCAVFTGDNLQMWPNQIGDPNPFWYTPSGGPGSTGNKIMEANLYAQYDGTWAGQTVTFQGNCNAYSLVSGYAVMAFLRDFAPDYSSVNEQSVAITATGNFSVSMSMVNDTNRHEQYGIQMKGPCVWSTDAPSKGTIKFQPQAPVATKNTTWGRLKAMAR